MALVLCGCASADKLPVLARAVPTQTCEKILQPVPLPEVRPTDDARVAFMRDDAALITANGRIDAGRNCVAAVRKSYEEDGHGSNP